MASDGQDPMPMLDRCVLVHVYQTSFLGLELYELPALLLNERRMATIHDIADAEVWRCLARLNMPQGLQTLLRFHGRPLSLSAGKTVCPRKVAVVA